MTPLLPLDMDRVRSLLEGSKAKQFGEQIHYHPQIDSTSNRARELAEEGWPEGTVVVTDEQLAGRGRMDRRWEAPVNSSLMFTTIFRPNLKVEHIQRVVMLCGLAIAEACEAMTGMKVDVKWPNDLLIGSKKMTGILPESALLSDEPEWVNVGTGINVNQMIDPADPLFETATSLMMACGQMVNREELFVAIMEKYAVWYKKLTKDSLLDAWRERCITLGQQVQVGLPTGILTGTATTILADGALLVMGADGSEYPVHASEATIIKS